MKNKIIAAISAAALLTMLFTPALAFEPGEAETTADWLNFRSEPNTSCTVIDLVPQGSKVEILEDLGDWCRVRFGGHEGYMSAQYLKQTVVKPAPTAEPTPAPTAEPSPEPTAEPTPAPTAEPSPEPTAEPTPAPTAEPVEEPAEEPAEEPVEEPAEEPVEEPAEEPVEEPAEEPEVQPAEVSAQPQSGVLTGDGVRFRSAPSLESDVYGYFYKGSRITVLEQADAEWYRVESLGRIGYVSAQYVQVLAASTPQERSKAAKDILAIAEENVGVPYVYGGASPDTGFDCSGFVYYCFTQNGYTMNRTASRQYLQGVYVEKEDLEPGDLVFFAGPGGWSIEHVGIYLGSGDFIHASTGSRQIMLSSLDNTYFSRYYYGARRILE